MHLTQQKNSTQIRRRPSHRRDLLQQLESRELFAAFSSASFDFRADYAGVQSGYNVDVGKTFAWQGNYQYGWNTNNQGKTVNRTPTGAKTSFASLGGSAASTWEVAVPNGTYDVSVSAGDASDVSAHYGINVEGTTVVNETPTWSDPYAEGSARVTVNDGRLTVTSASGSWNNKLDYVTVTAVNGSYTAPTGSVSTPSTPVLSGAGVNSPASPGWLGPWANGNTVGLNWGDNSNNETGFVIERSTDGVNFSQVGQVGANVHSFNAGALNGWTKYFFRVKAINSAGSSGYATGNVTTGAVIATPTTTTGNIAGSAVSAPAAPGWLGPWANGNNVGLNWGDNSNNETGFVIERSTDGWTYSQVGQVGANVTTFNAGALNGWTKYYFRVKAINSAGSSGFATANVTTGAVVSTPSNTWTTPASSTTPVPAAPSWTWAGGASGQVSLTWADVANETGYIITRSTDNRNFSEVARVNANVTSYVNYGLNSGTTYYYRIQSYNAGGTNTGPTASATTTATVTAPSTPSWLSGAASGTNGVNLVWGDASNNETGFIIERSTDGWNFSEIARVGQGVNSYAANGLNAGTKYVFRVKAYNAGGTSNPSQTATVTTNAASTSSGSTSSGSVSTAGMNKSAVSGMVPNQISASTAIPMLQQLGSKAVRLWYSVGNWSDRSINSWDLSMVQQYKNAGYTVTLAINNPNVPDYNTAKGLYSTLANSQLKNYVDYWEVGNEPNMYEFWHGSLQQFVTNNMRPAYEALHAVGEKVIGGAVSWDVNACKQLQSYGYSNYCDYSGFHPYGESGNIVAQRARDAKAAFGNKPMIITEWNVQSLTDANQWSREITIAATQLSNIAVQNYYYALVVDWSHVGKGGTFNSNGSRNTPFFNAVYSWQH